MEKATKIIPDLDNADLRAARKALLSKIEKAKPSGTYRGANYYVLGDKGAGYIVLERNGEILYFVRHQQVRHNGFQLGRQVLVWRDKSDYSAAGFAKFVFFDILLPKYGTLVADQEQTNNGREFWQYAISLSLERGFHVYFLDRRSTPNRLIKLETDADVIAYSPDMWGTTNGHLRTFAVISRVELK